MEIEAILSDLGDFLDCGNLKFNDHGVCRLVFDETMIVDIQYEKIESSVIFYSALSSYASGMDNLDYEALLAANFDELSSEKSHFALDRSANELVLVQRFDLKAVSFENFTDRLEAYVNTLEKWQNKLNAGILAESNTADQLIDAKGTDMSDSTETESIDNFVTSHIRV